jgi:hypothetical protein
VPESGGIEVTLHDGEVVVLTSDEARAAIKALLSDTMFEGSTSMAAQLQVALLGSGRSTRERSPLARRRRSRSAASCRA